MSYELIGSIIVVVIAVLGGAVAWGKLNRTVESHTASIEDYKMGDLVSEDDCVQNRDVCKDKLDAILSNIKTEVGDLKTDIRQERVNGHEYREKTAGSLGRIEARLEILLAGGSS